MRSVNQTPVIEVSNPNVEIEEHNIYDYNAITERESENCDQSARHKKRSEIFDYKGRSS